MYEVYEGLEPLGGSLFVSFLFGQQVSTCLQFSTGGR